MVAKKIDYDYIKVEYKEVPIEDVLKSAGLNDDGAIQTFHTQNVLRRMVKYMPYKSGALIKLTLAQTDISKPVIITKAPQAYYLYRGTLWVGDDTGSAWARKGETKHETGIPLKFNQEKNPQAGAQWDVRLKENEMAAMTADLQRYIQHMARRNK